MAIIRWRIAFWDWAFRRTNPYSAWVSWQCIKRLSAAETDRWLADVA